VSNIKLFDAVVGCRFQIRSMPNSQAQARPVLPDAECSQQPTNETI
jgi:hypothetical protein